MLLVAGLPVVCVTGFDGRGPAHRLKAQLLLAFSGSARSRVGDAVGCLSPSILASSVASPPPLSDYATRHHCAHIHPLLLKTWRRSASEARGGEAARTTRRRARVRHGPRGRGPQRGGALVCGGRTTRWRGHGVTHTCSHVGPCHQTYTTPPYLHSSWPSNSRRQVVQ